MLLRTMRGPTVRRTALVSAALLLALAAPAPGYEIGHTSASYTDPDRGDRSVPTEIFYPATAAGEDVPVAPAPPGGYPIVAFGHGYLIPWDDYDYIWEGLVPEGLIVALPRTETGLLPSHGEFGGDLAFVVRRLRAESDDPSSLLFGAVSSAGAVAGHSMGGGASVLAAAQDSTITAVANLAAAETDPSAIGAAAGITVPALLFSGGNDCVTPPADHQIPMYDALASDCRTRITISGASHCQFAEYNFTCSLGEGGCPDPTITRQEQHDLTVSLLTPWLEYALRNDIWAWLDFVSLLETTPGLVHEQDCASASIDGPLADLDGGSPGLALSPCFPNPFASESRIAFSLPGPARVTVRIYSLAGRLIATIADADYPAGLHTLAWDGRDGDGRRVASGVYHCRAEADGRTAHRTLVMIR